MPMLPLAAQLLDHGMIQAGLSNRRLAVALEVRPNMVSMMRTGSLEIPVGRIEAIAALIRVPVEDLALAGLASYPASRSWQAFALGWRLASDHRAAMASNTRENG